MSIQRARLSSLLIPVFLVLTGCARVDLSKDPRSSKFADLMNSDYQKAAKILDAALQKDPEDIDALYWRATLETEKGNADDGVDRLNVLLTRYPNFSYAYSERARANFKLMHFEKAVDDATTAIRLAPNVSRNYSRRARAYLLLHQPDKALADLQMSTKLNPDEDKDFIQLMTGMALMDLKRYQEALPILSGCTAAAAKNKDPKPFVERGLCYAHLKNFDKARADSDKAMSLKPSDMAARVLKVDILSATGKRQQARDEMGKAVRGAPLMDEGIIAHAADLGASVPSVADAAFGCLSVGNHKLAKAVLTLVQGSRPLDGEELFALAKAHEAEHDFFRAAKLLNECLATQPTWIEPRLALIHLYLRDNLPQKAREVQREGLALPLSPADRRKIAAAV